MSNEMIGVCSCCGEKTHNDLCNYCGYINVVDIDGSDNTIIKERAVSHKNRIIDAIKNISVKTYKYEWNASKSDVDLLEEGRVKICDGKDCFEKMFLCAEDFKQNPAENEDRELNLYYLFNGAEKNIAITIRPEKSPESWKLGIMIDAHLKLSVYIGYNGKYVEKTNINLDLHE